MRMRARKALAITDPPVFEYRTGGLSFRVHLLRIDGEGIVLL